MHDDWRKPYRSMDASGAPDTAEAVGWAWIDAVATEEIERQGSHHGFAIDSPPLPGDGRVIVLYHETKPIAVATIFRDPVNFSILVRWRA